MKLFNLARKESAARQPARDALASHVHQLTELIDKRAALGARDTAAARDEAVAADVRARIDALNGEIDQATASERYSGQSSTGIAQLRDRLRAAEGELTRVSGYARSAAVARKLHAQELIELNAQHRTLLERTDSLLLDALREVGTERRAGGRYLAAVAELQAAIAHELMADIAADQIADRHGWPTTGAVTVLADFVPPELFPESAEPGSTESALAFGKKLELRRDAERQRVRDVVADAERLAVALMKGELIA